MASLRKGEKTNILLLKRERARGDPEMIFKVYSNAFFGNVLECSCSSLRMKFGGRLMLERNGALEQGVPPSAAVTGTAFHGAVEFSPRRSLLAGYL